MTEALPTSPSGIVQQADKFMWDGNALEAGIALALSGGGFRAMLFHSGALARLNELGLLSKVARISSVSGGSIAAGYLAGIWDKLGAPSAGGVFAQFQETYVNPMLNFSRQTCSRTPRCKASPTSLDSCFAPPTCKPACSSGFLRPMLATTSWAA